MEETDWKKEIIRLLLVEKLSCLSFRAGLEEKHKPDEGSQHCKDFLSLMKPSF